MHLALTLGMLLSVPAADPIREAPRPLKASVAGVGRLVPDLAFADLNGKPGKLSDYKDQRYLVIAFTNSSCPLAKKFAPTLVELEKAFASKQVAFLYVNPTATDDPGTPTFAGRYVHDKTSALSAALGATSTTEVIVLDPARTVVYRGAVDDQYGLGYALDAPRQRYLATALNQLLAGQQPDVSATTAPGCALDLDAPSTKTTVTFHNRISRIIQQNCQECHRDGGVGPFPLVTLEDVKAHRGMIRKVVDRGTMPPWFAAPEKDGHSRWANDRSLAPADKADLLDWLASDMPVGDPAEAPKPRTWPGEWIIGKPDAIFQIPEPIQVQATGTMPYQRVLVETDYTEDKWVTAMEVQPTERSVVHHVLVHIVPKGFDLNRRGGGRGRGGEGEGGRPRQAAGAEERQGFFAIYVPGNSLLQYPEGFAKRLPKNSTLLFEIHYTPNGKATQDQTRVGFVFSDTPPKHEVKVAGVVNPKLAIPPHAADHPEEARLPIPFDIKVLAFAPHMHLRGKACKYELKHADGTTTTLLDVPHYDFNWQLLYRFAEPVRATRGSTMVFTGRFDNSADNPANPDPSKEVRWGPQTYDEMLLGYVEYYEESPGAPAAEVKIPEGGIAIPDLYRFALRPYDTNNDGKLDKDEIDAMPDRVKERVKDYIRRTQNN